MRNWPAGLLLRKFCFSPLAALAGRREPVRFRRFSIMLMTAAVAIAPAAALAEPTDITVRVISLGGKFIGSTMGGARIILRDAQSGEILAEGRTEGTTGDTARIMTGGPRNIAVADGKTAAFHARIDIDEPRLVEVEAYGPLAQPQSAMRVTARQWVLPGRGVTAGDGWVLEMPGLVVDMVEPAAHRRGQAGKAVRVAVNVALMCGCPIEPGGLWDAARFDVRATVRLDGRKVAELPLPYAGHTGYFAADLKLDRPGGYVITVAAVDGRTGATGVDRSSILIR